jgi:hypothetical protein
MSEPTPRETVTRETRIVDRQPLDQRAGVDRQQIRGDSQDVDRQQFTADRETAGVERRPSNVVRPTWRDDDNDRGAAALLAARDSVRWGPIVAGVVTAMTTFLLLSLLALGIGITAASGASGDQTQTVGLGGAITAAVIGLFAFFLGGVVAGRTSAVVGRPAGALNGFLVWALGVVTILALGAFGLSSILGAAGNIVGQTGVPSVSTPSVDPTAAADTVRNSAIGAFISLAIPAIAAALGGIVGVARDVESRIS